MHKPMPLEPDRRGLVDHPSLWCEPQHTMSRDCTDIFLKPAEATVHGRLLSAWPENVMSNTAIDPRTLTRTVADLPPDDDDFDGAFFTAGARSEAFAEDLLDEPAGRVEPVRRRAVALKPWWLGLAASALVGVSAVTASLMAAAFTSPL
jgi:hypothetical protein